MQGSPPTTHVPKPLDGSPSQHPPGHDVGSPGVQNPGRPPSLPDGRPSQRSAPGSVLQV